MASINGKVRHKKGSSYKRLIVCSDGTWQGSDKGVQTVPSNVARMVKAIAPKKQHKGGGETQQIVYYQSGVGSTSFSPLGNVTAGATGAGLDDNVLGAYHFICDNYEIGDEIFLFGFSRGAYTVRTLGGLLGDFDIIDKYSLNRFPEFYAAYQRRDAAELNEDGTRKRDVNVAGEVVYKYTNFENMWQGYSETIPDNYGDFDELTGKANSEKVKDELVKARAKIIMEQGKIPKYEATIKIIGVFDTVGSMGIPENTLVKYLNINDKQKFREVGLSTKIENAFHALALDEHRSSFLPTLWHIPVECRKNPTKKTPNLVQCWFPGVHINCGGGNSDNCNVDGTTLSTPRLQTDYDARGRPIPTPKDFINSSSVHHSIGSSIMSGIDKINPFSTRPVKTGEYETTSNADMEELADITFAWMVDRCRPFLEFDEPYLTHIAEEHEKKVGSYENPNQRTKARTAFSNLLWPEEKLTFRWGCGPIEDSFTGIMALGGSSCRAPGQYSSDRLKGNVLDDTKDKQYTNEYMHPSVRYRYFMNEKEYARSRGLHGFRLVDHTEDRDLVEDDPLSTGMIWEKKVAHPSSKLKEDYAAAYKMDQRKEKDPTIMVSEMRIEPELSWVQNKKGKQKKKTAQSFEYRLMGDKIFQDLVTAKNLRQFKEGQENPIIYGKQPWQ